MINTTLTIPHIDHCVLCNLLPYGDYLVLDARCKDDYDKECIVGSLSCPPPEDIDVELSLEWITNHVTDKAQRDKLSWATMLHVVIAAYSPDDPWTQRLFRVFCGGEFTYPPEFVSVPNLKRRYPLLMSPGGEKRLSYRFRYPSEIIEDMLWLGSVQTAHNEETVRGLAITHIVNATNQRNSNKFEDFIQYFNVNIDDEDTEDISAYFTPVCAFIQSALDDNGRVLVHCHAGISRSAVLTINFLRHYFHWNLRQAYRHAISRRPEIHPNRSFMEQLVQFEELETGERSVQDSDLGPHGGLVEEKFRQRSDEQDWRPFVSLGGRDMVEEVKETCVVS